MRLIDEMTPVTTSLGRDSVAVAMVVLRSGVVVWMSVEPVVCHAARDERGDGTDGNQTELRPRVASKALDLVPVSLPCVENPLPGCLRKCEANRKDEDLQPDRCPDVDRQEEGLADAPEEQGHGQKGESVPETDVANAAAVQLRQLTSCLEAT